ncbi:hypothetical protein Ctob_000421 [Chrysochromulina tobinii]|uniref:Uncharacterized protein n=1 Tax=Chrysochromulina tobinii TaxID=1460289 RepID=A0A0M0JD35_9EUKA|nr:hypothetical protein Ctob_000421 [Chrysochromulina tobinii]|eukprot:KOO24471.1 hypothetical protein Ctob_000421 [Chrysochromulina sp. CCMP291]
MEDQPRAARRAEDEARARFRGYHQGRKPSLAWRARVACCTLGRADTPWQLGRAAE